MTPEHAAARIGKVTGSRVADVVARTKSGYGASRANYMGELIVERLTGLPYDQRFTSRPMEGGIENEPAAREHYAGVEGVIVDEVGFVDHPTIPMAGASADGIVAAKRLVSFKCPLTATHIETLIKERVPGRYITQLTWEAACWRCLEADYVSYDPRCPVALQYICIPVEIDPAYIVELEEEVVKFQMELEAKLDELRAKFGIGASRVAGDGGPRMMLKRQLEASVAALTN